MEPGFYPDLDNETYQASPGVSVSRLKRFAEAPAKALVQRPETRALEQGTLIHTAILEREQLEPRFVPADCRAGTKAWEELERRNPGRSVVRRPDYEMALRVRDAVMRHPIAHELLAPALAVEQSFAWIDEPTGLLRRGRADGIRHDMKCLIDVKSTTDASASGFAATAGKFRYDWQDPWYREGIEATLGWEPSGFVFIAVEKEEPHLTVVYEIDPADVDQGRDEVRALLQRYAECSRTGVWPGYPDGLEYLRIPAWAKRAA